MTQEDVTIITNAPSAAAIIYPYFRTSGYVYLHIPRRLTKECNVTSGVRFIAFVEDSKVIIEQEGKKIKEGKDYIT